MHTRACIFHRQAFALAMAALDNKHASALQARRMHGQLDAINKFAHRPQQPPAGADKYTPVRRRGSYHAICHLRGNDAAVRHFNSDSAQQFHNSAFSSNSTPCLC